MVYSVVDGVSEGSEVELIEASGLLGSGRTTTGSGLRFPR